MLKKNIISWEEIGNVSNQRWNAWKNDSSNRVGSSEDLEEDSKRIPHVHLWMSSLLTDRVHRFMICNTYCMFIFLVFGLFVCFFGQVIKWEYNSVSINNVLIKFINLEHYLLLHTCQLFLNNQSNLFQMWKITNCFAHLNIAFFCFSQY